MYIKRYVVARGDKRYAYLRLVKAFRGEDGRVRHEVIATLGREDELKASGQLDHLAASFTRLDPPPIGRRREVGPLLLVHHVISRLDLIDRIDRHLPQRGRADLTTGEVITALVVNRLCAPAPLYDVAAWAAGAVVQEIFDIPGMLLNDDRLGRALDAFAPAAESIRSEVALAAMEAFSVDASRLHLDLTTLRVSGAYENSSFVKKGWGADRHVKRQVRVLQAVNRDGIPLYVRPHPGDAAELTCIGAALEQLAKVLRPAPLICADSAFGHVRNLCMAARLGFRFLVPLRADTGFAETFLRDVGSDALVPLQYCAQRQKKLDPSRRSRYRGALRPWAVTDPVTGEARDFRVLYVWSSEEASSVEEARQRALTKIEADLEKLRRATGRRPATRELLEARIADLISPRLRPMIDIQFNVTANGGWTFAARRNTAAIEAAARTDGIYALATNLPGRLSPSRVLKLYKDQAFVEMRHRDAKQTLRVRPIFLHNDQRIEALVSVVGLALLVFGIVEHAVRSALGSDTSLPLLPEGRSAPPTGRAILATFQGLGITYAENGPVLDALTPTQRQLLGLLAISPPWPEHTPHPALSNCGKRG